MTTLNRHELNFKVAFAYLNNNLVGANTLSSTLMQFVNFKVGRFFTLLPSDAKLQGINEFNCGGIASGVRDQISSFVLCKMHADNQLSCVFDDVTAIFQPEYKTMLFSSCGLVYKTEIYYLVTGKTASKKIVEQCFLSSNAIWHSLCVLSRVHLMDNIKKNISLHEIETVCQQAYLIIVGAYDGEGYIFWEKTPLH